MSNRCRRNCQGGLVGRENGGGEKKIIGVGELEGGNLVGAFVETSCPTEKAVRVFGVLVAFYMK
jgi:hypothetical protein